MKDLFWNIFKTSGNIDAFLAYKEFCNENNNHNNDNIKFKENNKSII